MPRAPTRIRTSRQRSRSRRVSSGSLRPLPGSRRRCRRPVAAGRRAGSGGRARQDSGAGGARRAGAVSAAAPRRRARRRSSAKRSWRSDGSAAATISRRSCAGRRRPNVELDGARRGRFSSARSGGRADAADDDARRVGRRAVLGRARSRRAAGAAAGRGGAAPPSRRAAARPLTDAERARNSARLREAVKDPDRRVRTEALRTLAGYDDDASFAVVLAALDSPDTWLSVSAAEVARPDRTLRVACRRHRAEAGRGRRGVEAARAAHHRADAARDLRARAAVEIADALARDSSLVARLARRRRRSIASMRQDARSSTRSRPIPRPKAPDSAVRAAARGRGPRRRRDPTRSTARIVERWIVPDYNGAPKPRAIWETARGTIEIELLSGRRADRRRLLRASSSSRARSSAPSSAALVPELRRAAARRSATTGRCATR